MLPGSGDLVEHTKVGIIANVGLLLALGHVLDLGVRAAGHVARVCVGEGRVYIFLLGEPVM